MNSFLARKYIHEQVVSFSPFLDVTGVELLKSELAGLVVSKYYATCGSYHFKLITHLCKDNTVLAWGGGGGEGGGQNCFQKASLT